MDVKIWQTLFWICEWGGRLQKCKTPNSQKCSGECSGKGQPETGCSGQVLGEVLRKVLATCVSSRKQGGMNTFPSTSPSTPFLAGTSPSTLPSTFWGAGGFCTSVAGSPVRNSGLGRGLLCSVELGFCERPGPLESTLMDSRQSSLEHSDNLVSHEPKRLSEKVGDLVRIAFVQSLS